MISAEEYLSNLKENSVWVFTKQETDFDEGLKASKLFYDIPNKENMNIESVFSQNHNKYGIETDRHRILVIPQMLGLITKTPFYQRGGQYNKERNTYAFEKIYECRNDSKKYNMLKTEQLLKVKIHAIIDTANNNEDCYVLPIIFIYQVLKELQIKYNINKVSIGHLYTYIMTCKNHSQISQAVEYIRQDAPESEFVKRYKNLSRILTWINKNINLFLITSDTISINPKFDNYFYENFILRYDLDEMNEILYREVDYSYFLYNLQDFNINLVDEPEEKEINTSLIEKVAIIKVETTDEEEDTEYIEKIDKIKESNINEDVAIGAYNIAPMQTSSVEVSKKYKRNPLLGKIAIQKAYYCCENDHNHVTFISEKTQKSFMEAHHLVPVKDQKAVWEKYNINVDCVENIVSLCPTCHRAFHHGTKEVKAKIIENVFQKLVPRYKSIDFNITVEEIKEMYKV